MSNKKRIEHPLPPSYDQLFAPPSYPHEKVELCSITLFQSDSIKVIGASQDLLDKLRMEIRKIWGWQEIQKEFQLYYCYEFKLKGVPWFGLGVDAVRARQVVMGLLKCMALHGWVLLSSVDLSKSTFDADTLFFEKGRMDPDTEVFAVSMNLSDRIRLITPPPTYHRFSHIRAAFKEIVVHRWGPGIQEENHYTSSNYSEFKLVGNPWKTMDEMEAYRAKLLITRIIAGFNAVGFRLYASIDLSTGTREGRDMDTLFFRRVSQNWPVVKLVKF